MTSSTFLIDSFATAPPPRTSDEALDQAMLRAYAIERAIDYGCTLEDVLKLRRRVDAGHGWSDIALQLADDDELRAAHANAIGEPGIASRFLLQAAACCRVAQASLEHDVPQRLQAYERQARLFQAALQADANAEHFHLMRADAAHAAWLFRAPGLESGGAAVVVWGGADGWCEAFHPSVPFYLERGLSVCLLELPGQGLARLRHRSMLAPDFTQVVSATLDALVARGASPDRLGIAGHSAGGSFALAAAAADDRIRACCSNGGSPYVQEGLARFPRVLQRFGRMLGEGAADGDVLAFFERLDLPRAAGRMRAALLCMHGGQDALVTNDEAHRLVALRGAPAATLAYWPDGAHCVYNHAVERNCVAADWFARQLSNRSSP